MSTKFLQDHPDLPQWAKDFVNQFGSTSQNRDDDLEDYLAAETFVPALGVIRAVPEAVPTGSGAVLTYEGITFQSTSLFSWDAGDPGIILVEDSGIISIVGNVVWAASAAGSFRTAEIYVNGVGSPIGGQTNPPLAGNPTQLSVATTFAFEAGDTIEMRGNQDSGGDLGATSSLSVSYLGKTSG